MSGFGFGSLGSALPSNSASSAAAVVAPAAMAVAKRSGRLAKRPGYAEEQAAIQAAFEAKNAAATARKQALFQAAKDALDSWYAYSENSEADKAERNGVDYNEYILEARGRLETALVTSGLKPKMRKNILNIFDKIEENTQKRLAAAKSMGVVAPPVGGGGGGGGGGAAASTAFDLGDLFAALEDDDVEMAGGRRRGRGRSSRKSKKTHRSTKSKKSKKSKKSRRTHRK
jgi:hypothetical protein